MKSISGATDMEIVLFYMAHIEHPCIERTTGKDIREFYIRRAEKILPKIENPFGKSLLEATIAKYKS